MCSWLPEFSFSFSLSFAKPLFECSFFLTLPVLHCHYFSLSFPMSFSLTVCPFISVFLSHPLYLSLFRSFSLSSHSFSFSISPSLSFSLRLNLLIPNPGSNLSMLLFFECTHQFNFPLCLSLPLFISYLFLLLIFLLSLFFNRFDSLGGAVWGLRCHFHSSSTLSLHFIRDGKSDATIGQIAS